MEQSETLQTPPGLLQVVVTTGAFCGLWEPAEREYGS